MGHESSIRSELYSYILALSIGLMQASLLRLYSKAEPLAHVNMLYYNLVGFRHSHSLSTWCSSRVLPNGCTVDETTHISSFCTGNRDWSESECEWALCASKMHQYTQR